MIDLELPLDFDSPDTSIEIPLDTFPGRDFPISNRKISTVDFRTRMFLHSLSPQRCAEIARRPRFRNQPYLRRQDEPEDDFLP